MTHELTQYAYAALTVLSFQNQPRLFSACSQYANLREWKGESRKGDRTSMCSLGERERWIKFPFVQLSFTPSQEKDIYPSIKCHQPGGWARSLVLSLSMQIAHAPRCLDLFSRLCWQLETRDRQTDRQTVSVSLSQLDHPCVEVLEAFESRALFDRLNWE